MQSFATPTPFAHFHNHPISENQTHPVGNHDLTVELVDMGATKKQIEDIQNAYKSLTATVPDKIKAQGPNAENAYRNGIANGKTGAELEAYVNSENFQAAVTIMDSYDNAIEKYGSGNIPEQYTEKILGDLNTLLFDQEALYKQHCASGPLSIEACNQLMKGAVSGEVSYEIIQTAIIDYLNGNYDEDKKALFETTLPAYLDCLANLSVQGTKESNKADADIMKRLDIDLRANGYSFAKAALAVGLNKQGFFSYGVGKETASGMKVAGKETASDTVAVAFALAAWNQLSLKEKGQFMVSVGKDSYELAKMLAEDPSLLKKIAKETGYEIGTSNLDLAEYTGNKDAMRFYDGYNSVKVSEGVISFVGGPTAALKIAKGFKGGSTILKTAGSAADDLPPINYQALGGWSSEKTFKTLFPDLPKNQLPLGKGSTGRYQPKNLQEQQALKEAMTNVDNPNDKGFQVLKKVPMNDSRWPSTEGWQKMQYTHTDLQTGRKTTIHYVRNKNTGAVDDFKFKD